MRTGITKSDSSLVSKAQKLFFHKGGKSTFFEDTVADTPIQPFFSSSQPSLQVDQKTGIQTKLTMGQPDDTYEHEAESLASPVIPGLHQPSSLPAPALQAKCAACEQEEKR